MAVEAAESPGDSQSRCAPGGQWATRRAAMDAVGTSRRRPPSRSLARPIDQATDRAPRATQLLGRSLTFSASPAKVQERGLRTVTNPPTKLLHTLQQLCLLR